MSTVKASGFFVLDTCVWVNFNDEHDLVAILEQLTPHVEGKSVVTLAKVLEELKRRWKPIHREVRKLAVRVKPADEMHPDVVLLAGQLLREHPFLGQALTPYNTADPWIIAAAKIHGWVVVTDEGTGRRTNRSMRGVCKKHSVRCLDRYDFAREIGITL